MVVLLVRFDIIPMLLLTPNSNESKHGEGEQEGQEEKSRILSALSESI